MGNYQSRPVPARSQYYALIAGSSVLFCGSLNGAMGVQGSCCVRAKRSSRRTWLELENLREKLRPSSQRRDERGGDGNVNASRAFSDSVPSGTLDSSAVSPSFAS